MNRHIVTRAIRNLFVVVFAVAIIFGAFRLVGAGSLTPTANPAGTMNSLSDLYSVLVGSYDSSGVSASKDGNALQISKCIIRKVNNESACP